MVRQVSRKLAPTASGSLLLSCVLAAVLLHSYGGIVHDARLYTLQALARLNPVSLGQDVFLRFGSQDSFTIFSPIYAAAIQSMGAEPAAALLTFLLQLLVVGAAFFLAKTVMPAFEASIGAIVLVSIPGDYGTDQVFTCIEAFITSRMAAEACVLGALAAAMANRRTLTVLLATAAALFHPIMATAGLVALAYRFVVVTRRTRVALWASASCAVLLFSAALLMPEGKWGRFDPLWLKLVADRSPYLFLRYWTLSSWGAAAVSATTLLLGYLALPDSRARSLCHIALVTVTFGFAVTLIAVDALHIVLVTQLQPWRCQWLGVVISALTLPLIASTLWQRGTTSRATALFLASAWIFASDQFALLACATALTCQFSGPRLTLNSAKTFLYGAWGMMAIALTWRIASNLTFSYTYSLNDHLKTPLKHLISFCHDGLVPVVLLYCVARFLSEAGRMRSLLIYACCAVVGAIILPGIFAQWTRQDVSSSLRAKYETWRSIIPPGSQVYWPQSPEYSWMLLDRPNYISSVQSAGVLFSRATAIELQHRAESLRQFVAPASFLLWDSGAPSQLFLTKELQGMCNLGAFDFLVTSASLDSKPLAIQPDRSAQDPKAVKLYRCSSQARAAAAAT
jgi:hypothetical protein